MTRHNNQREKKRNCKIVDFAVPADHRIKLKESEKNDKYLDFARELKKLLKMKMTFIQIVIGALGTVTKILKKGSERLGKKRTSGDNPSCCVIEIDQNT